MNTSKEKYTVICDARYALNKGIKTLVMLDKKKTQSKHWWTGTDSEDIIRYKNKEAAEKTAAALKNNARVLPVSEALQILSKQKEAFDKAS